MYQHTHIESHSIPIFLHENNIIQQIIGVISRYPLINLKKIEILLWE